MTDAAELLTIARGAVALADDLLRTRRPTEITAKGDRDMATDLDYTIEREVREFLRECGPDISFLGEEEGHSGDGTTGTTWVLDPIDGTANFAQGIPLHAVSLGLIHEGRSVLGVISTPLDDRTYWAVEGRGAYLGDERIQASTATNLADAIIAVGDYAVGDGADVENRRRFAITQRLAGHVQRVRMLGTAAIDLAWVAHGRLTGSLMLANKPWDTAAGVILAREAGALVLDAQGNQHTPTSTSTLAVAPTVADQLLDLIADIV